MKRKGELIKKDRSSKVIEIAALVVAIIGLSIGFAAYSTSFDVIDGIHVKPIDKFKIVFSGSENKYNEDKVNGIGSNGAKAGVAHIIEKPYGAITNLKAFFTNPGQKVVYTFYAHNRGGYDAFLKTITYSNVAGKKSYKVCSAPGASKEINLLVDRECKNINLYVEVGENIKTSGSITDITNHSLLKNKVEPIKVTIEYSENGENVGEGFFVNFGTVSLTYEMVPNKNNR